MILQALEPGVHYVSLPEAKPDELHRDVFPKVKQELAKLEKVSEWCWGNKHKAVGEFVLCGVLCIAVRFDLGIEHDSR